jgi:hypothetical protein
MNVVQNSFVPGKRLREENKGDEMSPCEKLVQRAAAAPLFLISSEKNIETWWSHHLDQLTCFTSEPCIIPEGIFENYFECLFDVDAIEPYTMGFALALIKKIDKEKIRLSIDDGMKELAKIQVESQIFEESDTGIILITSLVLANTHLLDFIVDFPETWSIAEIKFISNLVISINQLLDWKMPSDEEVFLSMEQLDSP